MDNYYRLLGLPPDATTAEIERRCLELGGQVRPDIHSDDIQAQQRFDEIERAFVTLTDPASRAAYDESLRSAVAATKPAGLKDINLIDLMKSFRRLTRWKQVSWVLALFATAMWGLIPWESSKTRIDVPRLFPEANIVAKCTTNGFGRVSCTFTNFGKAKGGRCVIVKLHKSSAQESIFSDAICSGLVEPSDVRDRTSDGQFFRNVPPFYTERESIQPHLFCSKGAIGESWIGDCTLTLVYLETR